MTDRSRWVLWAVLLANFATAFPFTILAVSLGPIAVELGSSETTLAWVMTAPLLLSAVTFPVLGKLGDLRGHRRVFLWGFATSTLASALTALAWDAPSLIALRTLSGVLGAATQPTSLALIFAAYPGRGRVQAMGWWSMTFAAAPALGLLVGGPLVDWVGWRSVFVIQAALSIGALALARSVLQETRPKRVRFDVPGALALAVGIGGLMLALGSVRQLGVDSPLIAAALVLGVLGLAAFRWIEARVDEPILPLAMLRQRIFVATLATNGFNSAAYMGALMIGPLLLYEAFAFSVTQAALLIAVRTASLTLGSPLGGLIGERFSERAASVTGCAVMTLGLALVAWSALASSLWLFALGLVGQGFGHGLSQPAVAAAIFHTVDESDLGVATAANRLAGQGGAAFGIAALMLVYSAGTGAGAFAAAFALGTLLCGISLLTSLGMGRPAVDERALEVGRNTERR